MPCTQKEKPTSGGNHLAGLNTQNTDESLPLLAVLERIAVALEKSNDIAVMQNEELSSIATAIYQTSEA
jgi:hypothetical protein